MTVAKHRKDNKKAAEDPLLGLIKWTKAELQDACWAVGMETSVRMTKAQIDRKSTRLNSSHALISYAVFCLKKKKQINTNS